VTGIEEKLLWEPLVEIPVPFLKTDSDGSGSRAANTISAANTSSMLDKVQQDTCVGCTYKDHLEALCAGKAEVPK
jgi:hypothetical protein